MFQSFKQRSLIALVLVGLIAIGGSSGDSFVLSFAVSGQSVSNDGAIGARIELLSGGSAINTINCVYGGARGTFGWQTVTCNAIIASANYDSIRITLGAQNVTIGQLAFDSVTLTPQ